MQSLTEDEIKVGSIYCKHEKNIYSKLDDVITYFKVIKNEENIEYLEDIKFILEFFYNQFMKQNEIPTDAETEEMNKLDISFIDKYLEMYIIDNEMINKLIDLYVLNSFDSHRFSNFLKIIMDNYKNFNIELFQIIINLFCRHSIDNMKDYNILFHELFINKIKELNKNIIGMYESRFYNYIQKDLNELIKAIEENKIKFTKKSESESESENKNEKKIKVVSKKY
jgi:hypothetical protein